MQSIKGQTAVITGATGGVGSATAEMFAEEGVALVLVDLREPELREQVERLRERGTRAEAVWGDVTDPVTAERARQAALDLTGRVDILVNNAGAGSQTKPLLELDMELWDRDIAINLNSQAHFSRAIVPAMVDAEYGRVVNIASRAGMDGPRDSAGYAAAKAGVIAMTKTFGKELAGTGVVVNALAPGMISTPMIEQSWMRDDIKAGMLAQIPMGRFALPNEAAAMIRLMSDPSLTYTTGQVFDLSGGRGTY